jgi:hypothetical protein
VHQFSVIMIMFHGLKFKYLTDQRALGMSMRVERASLEQVGYLGFCVASAIES